MDSGAETAPRMKLVIAIVRPEKANDVLEALYRAEVRGVSISRIEGHGGELDRVETYRGTTVQIGMADKVRFEIAVTDEFVQPTIDSICAGARTGEVGDGKIFVLPLERAVRIRTAEADSSAVTPVNGCASDGQLHPRRPGPLRHRLGRHRLDAHGDGTGDPDDDRARDLLLGLVRSKNALNTFMMSVAAMAVAGISWALIGYSLAFGEGGGFIGDFSYAFLKDVGFEPFAEGQTIPHLVFFAFQGSFCIITAALVSGAVVERMRFSTYLIFIALWSILVYPVLAHWVFGGGFLFDGGTLDFAGGVAVEMAPGSPPSPRRWWSERARTTAARPCCRTTRSWS